MIQSSNGMELAGKAHKSQRCSLLPALQLVVSCWYLGIGRAGVFTPWKLANATYQGFCFIYLFFVLFRFLHAGCKLLPAYHYVELPFQAGSPWRKASSYTIPWIRNTFNLKSATKWFIINKQPVYTTAGQATEF